MSKGKASEYGEPWRYQTEIEAGLFADVPEATKHMAYKSPPGFSWAEFRSQAEAERFVACMNALAGIKHPEYMPALLEAVREKQAKRAQLGGGLVGGMPEDPIQAALDKLMGDSDAATT